METDETPGVIITLVHGTWGRTRLPFSPPNWFEPESSFTGCFSQELASRNIQAAIHPFLWSGKNSLFARSEASVKLTQLIEKNAEKHPSAKQVIVGHSHGGSVALLAVRKLWTNVDPIIVTLATPFMEIVKSPPVGEEAKIKRYIATALPSVGLLLTLIWLFGVLNVHAYDQTLAFTGAFVLALRLLPSLYGVGKVDPPSELDWLAPATHRSDVYQALTVGGATLAPSRRTLVIRGVDDEAGMVLAFGSFANRLAGIAPSLTITLTYVGLNICLGALGFVLLGQHLKGSSANLAPIVSVIGDIASNPYFAYPAIYSIAVFFLFPIISGLFKSVYGRELIMGGVFCDIISASAPDAGSGMTVATLPPTVRNGLRHGIYNHELTAPKIAEFVAASLELRTESPATV